MGRKSKYPPEVRERAVRLVFEQESSYGSRRRVALKLLHAELTRNEEIFAAVHVLERWAFRTAPRRKALRRQRERERRSRSNLAELHPVQNVRVKTANAAALYTRGVVRHGTGRDAHQPR